MKNRHRKILYLIGGAGGFLLIGSFVPMFFLIISAIFVYSFFLYTKNPGTFSWQPFSAVIVLDIFGGYKTGVITASFIAAAVSLWIIARFFINISRDKKGAAVYFFLSILLFYASLKLFNAYG